MSPIFQHGPHADCIQYGCSQPKWMDGGANKSRTTELTCVSGLTFLKQAERDNVK